ncbi:MerR family transcriptional regulator [Planococcus halotolerans]|uniref:MerR family transcriptional regulator n=1 Tax=Planococcus halotolerans TaxID=2233542 RepID=A0A365L646_9BACL|nr:MerR family transcriptional regulator [Planococcus halotolerans]QHJ70392.1 MerR family transcriptional regulator [Planococcus halotolerans]RAZ80882.1 MerR family transcriptional regulator [Planococcus halotolerans]
MYKVQEVATIAGVSVRTLHHYDSIGLMKPSNIGSNRYRYYNDDDLKLLQHILFFKELGFSLKKIQELVAEGFDATYALTQHAELLRQKKLRIEKLIENAERTQLEYAGVQEQSNEERFSAFSIKKTDDNIKLYLDSPAPEAAVEIEAADKEIDSQDEILEEVNFTEPEPSVAQQETVANEPETAVATEKPEKEEEDLEEINREGDRIYNAVSNLMHLPPEAPEVQVEMQAYYTLLDRFYNCSPKMFRGLADLYANDSRFAKNIDRHGAGLSKYLREAMYIFADGLADA